MNTDSALLSLPPIRLSDLPRETRDWILTKAAKQGRPPMEVMIETLTRSAAADGFRAARKHQEVGAV